MIDINEDINDFDLAFCDKCFQMTNHLNGVCQKCKKVIPYVPPEELYRAPVI
jgi:hypothetical protein